MTSRVCNNVAVLPDVPVPCASSHYIIDISPGSGSAPMDQIEAGQNACWRIVLDRPVECEPLTVHATLCGSDQDENNYPNPSVTIPVGSDRGEICITTNPDSSGTDTLCLNVPVGDRIISSPSLDCNQNTPAPEPGQPANIAFSCDEIELCRFAQRNNHVPDSQTFAQSTLVIRSDGSITGYANGNTWASGEQTCTWATGGQAGEEYDVTFRFTGDISAVGGTETKVYDLLKNGWFGPGGYHLELQATGIGGTTVDPLLETSMVGAWIIGTLEVSLDFGVTIFDSIDIDLRSLAGYPASCDNLGQGETVHTASFKNIAFTGTIPTGPQSLNVNVDGTVTSAGGNFRWYTYATDYTNYYVRVNNGPLLHLANSQTVNVVPGDTLEILGGRFHTTDGATVLASRIWS